MGTTRTTETPRREMPSPPSPWRNPKVLTSLAAGFLLLVGWLLSFTGTPYATGAGLYVASLLLGGYYFGREALEELVFEREIGIELLMTVAAVVAALMGQLAEGAMLAFLYSISEAAEGYTEQKTRSAIKALMDLAPKTALVRRDGREVEIPAEEVAVGDVFIVKPGGSMPTDGRVVAGRSSVNEAPVTGESVPVEKEEGAQVYAGSINETGALEVEATKAFADNTISRIIQMVEEAQERKGKSHRFIERFGRWYSPSVLALGVAIALLPPLFFGVAWSDWVLRATVFIVAAAPCALVISIPITLVATLGRAARQGVLIKGGVYVEELAKVKTVALDKTGTLTRGEPEVTDVIVARAGEDGPGAKAEKISLEATEQALVAQAAGIERWSEHPLARAIVRHDSVDADVARLQNDGKTVVVVGTEKEVHGLIAIRDNVRASAPKVIEALHARGVRVAMLTGDNRRTAEAIARELDIDEVYAELKPDEKVAQVRRLDERYGHVAMVGDGVNDAPALAEATVGIAMGAAGTDVAMETADVVLMADDLDKLVYALELGQKNRRVVRQNLALSALVIGVLVVGAVTGSFTLPIAVIGHEISEFVVVGSGLRMLRA